MKDQTYCKLVGSLTAIQRELGAISEERLKLDARLANLETNLSWVLITVEKLARKEAENRGCKDGQEQNSINT